MCFSFKLIPSFFLYKQGLVCLQKLVESKQRSCGSMENLNKWRDGDWIVHPVVLCSWKFRCVREVSPSITLQFKSSAFICFPDAASEVRRVQTWGHSFKASHASTGALIYGQFSKKLKEITVGMQELLESLEAFYYEVPKKYWYSIITYYAISVVKY